MILRVKQESLLQEAEQIAGLSGELQSELQELYSCLKSIRQSWEGASYLAHQKAAEMLEQNGNECLRHLKKYPADILRIAAGYQEAEEANQQTVMSLKADIIQ